MLNPALDFPRYWETFARTGRVQMRDILQPDIAQRLHQCLHDEVPWQVALRDSDGVSRLVPLGGSGEPSSPEYREIIGTASRNATAKYGFVYESYMMVKALQEGRDPGLLLHSVLSYFNSAPFLDFCRTVADNASIRRVSAQATRFRPGMFLKTHSDIDSTDGRAVAYVINLSKRWQPDWGGLLHFLDRDGQVVDTFQPVFNSLSLFRVPAPHFVSMVTPWSEEPRLSITGWWETLAGRDVVRSNPGVPITASG